MNRELPPALRFALVGGANTLLDAGLFAALCYGAGLAPGVANLLSYGTGIASSFVLNRSWTFADRDHTGALAVQAAGFLAVSLSALALSTTLVVVAASLMSPLGAKLASIPITYLWSYQLTRRFIFKRKVG